MLTKTPPPTRAMQVCDLTDHMNDLLDQAERKIFNQLELIIFNLQVSQVFNATEEDDWYILNHSIDIHLPFAPQRFMHLKKAEYDTFVMTFQEEIEALITDEDLEEFFIPVYYQTHFVFNSAIEGVDIHITFHCDKNEIAKEPFH